VIVSSPYKVVRQEEKVVIAILLRDSRVILR